MEFPTTPDASVTDIEVLFTTTGDELYAQFKFHLPELLVPWVSQEEVADLFLAFAASVLNLVETNAPISVTGVNTHVNYLGTAIAGAVLP